MILDFSINYICILKVIVKIIYNNYYNQNFYLFMIFNDKFYRILQNVSEIYIYTYILLLLIYIYLYIIYTSKVILNMKFYIYTELIKMSIKTI